MGTPAVPTSHVKRRKRRWPWILLGLLAIFLVFVFDLAWAGAHAVDSFQQARDGLTAGSDSLQSGDVGTARNQFASAEGAGQSASDAIGHPAVTVVGWLPVLSDDVDAARRGAEAIVLAAEGGTAYADAADAAGWDGVTLPGFAPGGHIDAGAIDRAAPSIAEAADLLGRAEAELAPIDIGALQPPLDRLMQDAKDEIHTRAEQASIAANLARLLPPMLGVEGARTYLLVTLSPSDPRGAGGYPGVVGLLHVDGRRLSLSNLAPTVEIPGVPPVAGPADAKKAWGWAGIDRFFWDTTYTPDFPTAAGFMKGIWEAGGGVPVDGVISGDPALMASLLDVVGSVDTPAWPETITSGNVERIVGADVYRTRSSVKSDAWEVAVGTALWDAVLTRPLPVRELATAISTAADGGHLQVWSVQPDEQAALGALGVTGAFRSPTEAAPTVTLNGFGNNRAGYFAKTGVAVAGGTDAKGRPEATVTVVIDNRAPSGPRSILLGIHPGDVGGKAFGTFATDINVYLPDAATVTAFQVNGREVTPFEWHELGAYAVSWSSFIEPGKRATIAVTYQTPS